MSMSVLRDIFAKAIVKDPNLLGEALRKTFIDDDGGRGPSAGPYKLAPEFKAVELASVLGDRIVDVLVENSYCDEYDLSDAKEEFLTDYPNTQVFTNGDVHIAWYWDGDGTLLFVVPGDKIAVMNEDCKKDYGWQFVYWEV